MACKPGQPGDIRGSDGDMCSEFVSITTRKKLLRKAACIVDPLRLVFPMTITGKIVQDARPVDGGWDDELPIEVTNRADELWGDMSKSSCLHFQRLIGATPEVQ